MLEKNDYFFKLVCLDETNPFHYSILDEENFDNMQDLHKYMDNHIDDHHPDYSKWILLHLNKKNLLNKVAEPR